VSPVRIVAVFVLVTLLLAFERCGYYSMRSVLPLSILDAGGTRAQMQTVFVVMQAINVAAIVLSGVAGILLRPIWLIVAGSVAALVGYLVLALGGASAAPLYTGVVLVSGGTGLGKPALFALAALEIGHPREQLRASLFVLLYGMINVGAFLGPMSAGLGRFIPMFYPSAAVQLLVVVVSVVLLVVLFVTRKNVEAPTADAPRTSRVVLGAALLGLVLVPFLVQSMVTMQTQDDVLRRAGVPLSRLAMLMGLNPVVVVLSAGVLFIVSLILHFVGTRLPVLYATAAGLCFVGLASTPFVLFATSSSASLVVPLSMVGVAGLAVAEILVTPYALSRMLGDVSPRVVTAVAAGWFVLSAVVATATGPLVDAWPAFVPFLIAASALICLALGVGGFFAIRPLYRGFFGPTTPEPEPQ
jgi:hypothetical protein